jgi:hypothetical protein
LVRLKLIDPENYFAILILFRKPNYFACVAKFDLDNAKIAVYELHDLDIVEHKSPNRRISLLNEHHTKMFRNKMSVFIRIFISEPYPTSVFREIQLTFPDIVGKIQINLYRCL